MEQKAVKSNMKAFAIFYLINGHKTVIFKLRSTNGKQALQTFIRHHWNGLKYDFKKVSFDLSSIIPGIGFSYNGWVAFQEGFVSLFTEELK